MARAALRKCNAAGCNALVRQTYCDKHAIEKRSESENRPNSYRRGYDKRWASVRRLKLSEQPLCEDCLGEGRTEPASEVHHKAKVSEQPELRLAVDNLMSLCKAHHSRRTAKGE